MYDVIIEYSYLIKLCQNQNTNNNQEVKILNLIIKKLTMQSLLNLKRFIISASRLIVT